MGPTWKPYTPPTVTFELALETRTATPLGLIDPIDPAE